MFRAPTAKEKVKALRSEVYELRKGAPLPWGPNDSPADKARAVMEHLSILEAEELGLALLQAVKDARGTAPAPTPDEGARAPNVKPPMAATNKCLAQNNKSQASSRVPCHATLPQQGET